MNIGILLFHEVNELDVVGPFSVLNTALRFLPEDDKTQVFTLAKSRNSVQTSNEMTITPLYAFASAPPLDVLIVPGGKGVEKALRDKAIAKYLPLVIPRLKLTASISSGALLLGHYGLIRGKTVTTHPEVLSRLEDYEILRASKDAVVYDDKVWTCNGSVSGIQLAFELCKSLFGDGITSKVADVLNVQTLQGQLF